MTHHVEYGKTFDIFADNYNINSIDVLPANFSSVLNPAVGSALTAAGMTATIKLQKVGKMVYGSFIPSATLKAGGNANNTAPVSFVELVPVGFRPLLAETMNTPISTIDTTAKIGIFTINQVGIIGVGAGPSPTSLNFTSGVASAVTGTIGFVYEANN